MGVLLSPLQTEAEVLDSGTDVAAEPVITISKKPS